MNFDIEICLANGTATRCYRVSAIGEQKPKLLDADARAIVQIGKFLADEIGPAVTIDFFGETSMLISFSTGERATVSVSASLAPAFLELHPVNAPFDLKLPARILKANEEDALVLLRLGSSMNALLSLITLHARRTPRGRLTESRDLVTTTIAAASYVREITFILHVERERSAERFWSLAEAGVKAGRTIPYESLSDLRALLDSTSPLQQRVHTIRRQIGFHSAPPPFRSWLRTRPDDDLLSLLTVEDGRDTDPTFTASAQAVIALVDEPNDSHFFVDVMRLATTLSYVIEAAAVGLAIQNGLSPSSVVHVNRLAAFEGKVAWQT